jgi:hypothetical protein
LNFARDFSPIVDELKLKSERLVFFSEESSSLDRFDIEVLIEDDIEQMIVALTCGEGRCSRIDRKRSGCRPCLHPLEPRAQPQYAHARLFLQGTHLSRSNAEACGSQVLLFYSPGNAVGLIGFRERHKISPAMQAITYGITRDHADKYLRIGEYTNIEYVWRFAKVMI